MESGESEVSTQRIEAFSDGVFAIAITLLILEIKIPHFPGEISGEQLKAALLGLWPAYLTYVLSFIVVGIYWANHHYIFKLYKRTDHTFNLLNVFFLMCISFLPLPTAVIGEYGEHIATQRIAVIFYNLGLLLPAVGWASMWLYASRGYRLIDRRLAPDFVGFLAKQYKLSVLLYAGALTISFWSPLMGVAAAVGLTILYLLPPKKPVYLQEETE